jgi:putative two-component system response regulator
MPGIDGFEVAAKLKENPITAKIPIIFVTGEKDVKSFIKGFDLGAEDYIQKPFDPKVILFTVKSKLGLHN